MPSNDTNRLGALLTAIGAYSLWTLFPLYFALLSEVDALEVVAWRILCTLPFCLVMVVVLRQTADLKAMLTNPRMIAVLTLSGLLIGTNWLLYVLSIMHGHVLAASLGYYINPLVNVLAATLFLRERLTSLQWLAVALAAIGVAVLAWDALPTLWISLTLAFSFAGYGLSRKLAPIVPLPGLTVETMVLMIPAIGLLAWTASGPEGLSMGSSARISLLMLLAGPISGVPLIMFASAARQLDFSVLGFIQFITPTGLFLQGLFLFGEPLKTVQAICFVFIWTAIALFCWDLLRKRSAAARALRS
jgi:rarD protein